MSKIKLIFGFLTLYASILRTHAADTISANQILRYNQTITSPQETFELGFFSPLTPQTIMWESGTRKYPAEPLYG
ncbi:hypothetical protein HanRHA438_Chr11g0491241 [Helianthus annuus]|nr:hypothetical protein HanRHA438_Chr11g0491241 [Helianthus annuus]